MLESFLVLFRETLEAALVVGIVLGYLARTGQTRYRLTVWAAVAAGAAASVLIAWLFQRLAGGFEGRAEQIFEGLVMLAGAALLTTLIIWMAGKRDAAVKLEHGVERHLAPGGSHGVGLFLLVFLSVVREGVESVIFLGVRFGTGAGSLWGALAGLAAASLLGFLLFRGAVRVRLGLFFTVTNVLLLLFAAGLVAHGLHELVEAGWLPALVDTVWDLNPLLPEAGLPGSLLRGLFGYNGNPTLLELLGYAAYAAVAASLWRSLARKRRTAI
jgi:high-affinity iron transporter